MIIAIVTAISMSVPQRETPVREIPGVEVENMKVDSVYGGTTSVQDMVGQGFKGRWSGGKQLFWRVDKGQFNANMFLTFQTSATGEVTPILYFTQAPDYGMFALRINEKRVALLNGYAPIVCRTRIELPNMTIAQADRGRTLTKIVLRIDAYNTDEASKTRNLFVGLDRIEFAPAEASRSRLAESGICTKGGHHTATDSTPFQLPSLPYGMFTGRWCFGCGALFSRLSGDSQVGGSCHVDNGVTSQFGYRHMGNLTPDRLMPFADPNASAPFFYWCANCKAIYSDAVKPKEGVDACDYGNDPDTNWHKPYKNDIFAIEKADATGLYRVCKLCGLLYSVRDMEPELMKNNLKESSDCVTFYPKHGPHEPIPNEFYNVNPVWPNGVGAAWKDKMWAKCVKCKALFCMNYHPGNFGDCPAGGTHDGAKTRMYPLLHIHDIGTDLWFECSKCNSLFHGGTEAMNGACSAGGQHSLPIPFQPGSENQVMPSKTQQGGESAWFECAKCGVMFSAR